MTNSDPGDVLILPVVRIKPALDDHARRL